MSAREASNTGWFRDRRSELRALRELDDSAAVVSFQSQLDRRRDGFENFQTILDSLMNEKPRTDSIVRDIVRQGLSLMGPTYEDGTTRQGQKKWATLLLPMSLQ